MIRERVKHSGSEVRALKPPVAALSGTMPDSPFNANRLNYIQKSLGF